MIDSNKFNITLTNEQKNYLGSILPKFYSLQIDQEIQKPKQFAKIAPLKKIQAIPDEIMFQYDTVDHKRRKSKALLSLQPVERSNSLGKKDEIMKKWNQIKKIKKHQLSWPFRNPVNIKTLDIPNYYQIVTNPMDLHKIEEKLKNDQYQHPSEIQRDMNQIMLNSYKFNTKNESYFQATIRFQKYYTQLLKEQQIDKSKTKQLPQRNKKKQQQNGAYYINSQTITKQSDKSTELHNIQKQISNMIKIMNDVPTHRKFKSTNNACNIRYSRHENAMTLKQKRQLAQQIREVEDGYHLGHILTIIKKYVHSSNTSRKNLSEVGSYNNIDDKNNEIDHKNQAVDSNIQNYSVDLQKVDIKGLREIQNYLKLVKNNIYVDFNKSEKDESYLNYNSKSLANLAEVELGSEDFPVNT